MPTHESLHKQLKGGIEVSARWYGRRWVIAVSGGSDSVALLRKISVFSAEYRLELSVAHLNHGTRGEISLADEEFVKELAQSLDLPFDLGHWRPERTAHFEVDARRARYKWLVETAKARGASVIAVGHTQDDQAETILHRIMRGTGPRGLAGIPKTRRLEPNVALVRPLLDYSREALREYLQSINQSWREDASNKDTRRTRSKIRHELIPRLARDYNPKIIEALVRLGKLAGEITTFADRHIEVLAHDVVISRSDSRLELHRSKLMSVPLPDQAALVRHLWREQKWPEMGMTALRWGRLVPSRESSQDIGEGVRLIVTSETVEICRNTAKKTPTPQETSIPFDFPGVMKWGRGRIEATLTERTNVLKKVKDKDIEIIDLDYISLPLQVDSVRPGDRFDPLGMDGKTMPLADFFRSRNVVKEDREKVPVVRDGHGIIWVVGHRISNRVRLRENSLNIGQVQWFT